MGEAEAFEGFGLKGCGPGAAGAGAASQLDGGAGKGREVLQEAAIGLQGQARVHARAALLGFGGFAGLDWGQGGGPFPAVFIVKEQTCPGSPQMPLDVVGQQAKEEMR